MSRKKPQKKKSVAEEKAPSKASEKVTKPHDASMEVPFLKSVLLLIALFFTTVYLAKNVKGYIWLREKFVKGNIEKIEKFKDLTVAQKYQAYFRFNHQFLEYINENTPDTAIIYMPPDSVIIPEDGTKNDFYTKKKSNSVYNKVWSSYFIYPRKVVYDREREEIPNFDLYTHVACIDGWGYEYLEYNVPQNRRAKYQIFPRTLKALNRQNAEKAQQ